MALSSRPVGLLLGLVAAALFGGGAVVSRALVGDGFSAAQLTLLRYVGCTPAAALLLLICGRPLLDLSWGRLLTLLLIAGPAYHVLLIWGYAHASSGAGALLVTGLLPVFGLLCALLLTLQLPRWPAAVGAAGTLAGLAVVCGAGLGRSLTAEGIAIFAAAAFLWALLNALVRAWRIHPWRLTLALAVWAPLLLPAYVLTSTELVWPEPSAGMALQILYHGLVVALGATALLFAAIRMAGPESASALLALTPVFAGALGALLLGERISAGEIAGAAMTITGVLLMTAYAVPSDAGLGCSEPRRGLPPARRSERGHARPS